MKHLCILLLALAPLAAFAAVRDSAAVAFKPVSEVRIGWGDMIFESAMQYEFTHIGKPNTRIDYLTGHFFAEYQYHWLPWLASGMQIDFFQMGWHDRRELRLSADAPQHSYCNLTFLHTVRFTWFHSKYVNLYTSAFVGMTVNSGTELDHFSGRYTVIYPAFGLAMLGCQVGRNGWYGAVEWGGLSAMKNINSINMVSARIITVSIAYQFDHRHSKP